MIFWYVFILSLCRSEMQEIEHASLDLKTPRNVSLTAFYRRSFAFHTVKTRMPVIITQSIDNLARKKEDIGKLYGKEGQEELKGVIGELSKLKYEIQTNKPLSKLSSDGADVPFYNNYLDEQSVKVEFPTYFNAVWLHTECYMYRRMRQAFEVTTLLRDYDPFQCQKQEAFYNSLQIMTQLGTYLQTVLSNAEINVEEEFIKLVKLNLWGNKCDLSLSNGVVANQSDNLEMMESLNVNILSDHSIQVWDAVADQTSPSQIIDIILDNSGYELFTDLCLADFIIRSKLAQKIRFYVKSMPWFISDVMTPDFSWVLQQLKSNKNSTLKKLGERWQTYVKNKTWTVEDHLFWTLPITFTDMATVDPELYKKLGEAKLIIFKGDLSYRKLFGERNWDPTTDIEVALQGFHPSKLCVLRTLKADIVCGLKEGLADQVEKKDKDWMTTGKYGVIEFCDKVVPIE